MKTLLKFNNFIEELSKDNSRLYKIDILSKYKEDNDIQYYLHFLYSPYVHTGISNKKLNKSVPAALNNFSTVFDLLDYIKLNNTGRDQDITIINAFRNTLPECYRLLFDKIITQNLPLGIDAKTINKAFGKPIIEMFSVQLANKYFDNPTIIEGKEFAITTKIDGMRCIMIKENGVTTFWSRQGQEITGLIDLIAEANKIFPDNIILDGELIAKETDKANTYKNTMKQARTKETEKHNLKMMVFDYMSLSEFKAQKSVHIYKERRAELDKLFSKPLEYFTLLPVLYQGTNTDKVLELLDNQVSKGEEGIMINLSNEYYKFGRSNTLLKVKKFKDADLRVVGFEPGINKYQNTLGALLLAYKNGNIVKCGSGFSDEQRDEIWNNQRNYLNTIVEIKYFEETNNANGGLSLRFPIFKDFRFDKSFPNY